MKLNVCMGKPHALSAETPLAGCMGHILDIKA
jgi:hypothetical protein